MSEIIGSPSINLRAKYEDLFRDVQKATTGVEAKFTESNKRIATAQAGAMREMQGIINRLNGRHATNELNLIAQAVSEMGGVSKLSSDAVKRLTADVERLTAAGAKLPATLAGLQKAQPGKLGGVVESLASGGGLSGALGAIGPGGVAAGVALAPVVGLATAAAHAFADLAGKAEEWSNLAASTGLGVETVQQLQAFLEDAGIPAENMTVAMKNLMKEVANGGKDLEKFGVDVSRLADLSPEAMLQETARQIDAIEDPAQRTAAALAAFGKSGTDLIPVLTDVAAGSYKMYQAIGEDGVQSLLEADQAIDRLGRSWDDLKKRALAAVAVMATASTKAGEGLRERAGAWWLGAGFTMADGADQRTAADFNKARTNNAADAAGRDALLRTQARSTDQAKWTAEQRAAMGRSAEWKGSSLDEDLKDSFAATEAQLKVRKEIADEEKRAADDRLRKVQEQTAAEVALLKARDDALKADRAREDAMARASFAAEGGPSGPPSAGLGIDAMLADQARYKQGVTNAQAAAKAGLGADEIRKKLEAMGLSASDASKIVDQYVKKQDEAKKGTFSFSSQLADLAHTMQAIGGPIGKLGGLIGGLVGGASGIGAGIESFGKVKDGGLKGLLGKLGAGGQIATSALAIGSAVVGFAKDVFNGGRLKREAKEAGQILGKSVSKEQLQGLKDAYEEAKRDGKTAAKDFKSYLREQRYEEDKAKRESAAQEKAARQSEREQGLEQARAGIEAMQQALEQGDFSDAAREAFGQMAEEVRQVLLKAGMGYAFDSRLKDSAGYNAAQGLASGAAQTIAGMRTANGAVSEGLMTAGGTIAKETMDAAVAAAKAAGLSDQEAQQAGFGAISGLLREQLNASLASGRALDVNTKALVEQAKANGIDIIADPMVESVAVEKDMLAELKRINGSGGGAGGDGGDTATGRPPFKAAGGLRPVVARGSGVVNYHPNELVSRNGVAFRSSTEGFMPYRAGDKLFVLPASMMKGYVHAARGIYDDAYDERPARGGGGGGAAGAAGADAGTTTDVASGAAAAASSIEEALTRAISQIQPVQVNAQTTLQIVDNSLVRTEEGQRRFEKQTVAALETALDGRHAGLERRIEKIAERKMRDLGL